VRRNDAAIQALIVSTHAAPASPASASATPPPPPPATSLLLRPRRGPSSGASNALVDMIFHEHVAGTADRLVEFWVDTKHTAEHPVLASWNDETQPVTVADEPAPLSIKDAKEALAAATSSAAAAFAALKAKVEPASELAAACFCKREEPKPAAVTGCAWASEQQAYAAARDAFLAAHAKLERVRAAAIKQAFGSLPDELLKTTAPRNFISSIAAALRNPVLQNPRSRVDHVVLIIVAPVREYERVDPDRFWSVKGLGRLKSFSLYVVPPGAPGFANLVSQPVALTVPDMDDAASWSAPVSSLGDWASCCAATTAMVDTPWVFATKEEYEQYLRVVAECGGSGPDAAVALRRYLA
jgi:hypothetical protein